MASDTAAAGDDCGLGSKYARELNCLSDADRSKRKSALKKLTKELLAGGGVPGLEVYFVEKLATALVASFSDPVERLREDAVTLYTECTALAGVQSALPGLLLEALPTFTARIGSSPFGEPSEEIRLLLLQLLLRFIVHKGNADTLAAHLDEVVEVVARVGGDAFPAVKVAASQAVQALCTALPAHMPSAASRLAKGALANTGHQRGNVRTAAVKALARLLPLAGEAATKLLGEAVLPGLGPRLLDRTASVRKAVAATLAGWLHALPPPALAAHGRDVLFRVLSVVADTHEDVAAAALVAFHAAAPAALAALAAGTAAPSGAGGDLAVAAAAAAPEEGIPDLAPSQAETEAAAASCAAEAGVGEDAAMPGYEEVVLPHPFTARPPASARALVRAHLAGLVSQGVEGLGDWKADTRRGAAGALRSALVFGEGASEGQLPLLLPALCRATTDEAPEVVGAVNDCAALVGAFLPPAAQLGALLPQVRGEVAGQAGLEHRAAALAVLANAVFGMDPEAFAQHLPSTAAALADPALGDASQPTLHKNLLAALTACVEVGGEGAGGAEALHLLRTALHLMGPGSSPETHQGAVEALQVLAAGTGVEDVGGLVAAHAGALVAGVAPSLEEWTRGHPLRCELDAALRLAPLSFAHDFPAVVEVLTLSLTPSRDADLRLAQLALLDATAKAFAGQQAECMVLAAPVLVRDVLTPNLAWQVGAVASTVRKVAMACLHSVVSSGHLRPEAAVTVWPQLAPQLTSTLSDDDETTRHISVLCLAALLPAMPRHLDGEAVRVLYPELLKRLDDSADKVRLCACKALGALPGAASPTAMAGGPVEYTLEALLVHMDDTDAGMQAAASDAAGVYVREDPAHAVKAIKGARAQHRSPALCDALLAVAVEAGGEA